MDWLKTEHVCRVQQKKSFPGTQARKWSLINRTKWEGRVRERES